jgi:hypothetical protein
MYQGLKIDDRTKEGAYRKQHSKNAILRAPNTFHTLALRRSVATLRPCSPGALRQRFRKANVSEPSPNPTQKRHLQLKYFWILLALPIGRFYWRPAHSFPMTESQLRRANHWEIHTLFFFFVAFFVFWNKYIPRIVLSFPIAPTDWDSRTISNTLRLSIPVQDSRGRWGERQVGAVNCTCMKC